MFPSKGRKCPLEYTKSYKGSCYKFVDSGQGLTRSAAQSDCEGDLSHLVFLDTKEENDFLVQQVSRDTKYWIGLFSPKRHLFWDNKNQVTFVNLDCENQDTFNDGSGCFKMSNTDRKYWLDKSCKEELGFICEYEGPVCPNDWTNPPFLKNSCYHYVNDSPKSHISAQSKCQEDSAHLVFIESKEENDFLVGSAQNDTEYWIGLHDRPQLFWEDGNRMTFTNMDQSNHKTFNHRSGCYRMSNDGGNRLWFDVSCDNTFSYICEYKGSQCPPGYNKVFKRSCYKFVDSGEDVSWSEARSGCADDFAHLVYIETKEENDFLLNELPTDKKYWIGLFSPQSHLLWDNGNLVTFLNIDPKNEKSSNNHTACYMMSNTSGRYWLEKSCDREYGFICEYEGSGCPNSYTVLFNQSCYKIFNDSPASRTSAQLKCENDLSHLLFIESKEENDFLVGKAQNDTEYWIGLHDRPQLFWDDGKVASYTNINAGQDLTFDDRAGCYQMSNHDGGLVWFDESCEDNSGYVCEYEVN
ncbi:Macrophage mannose receptor 1 [Holothuria leucospilota]|uniref:Macrophage mannose receptor 1 n=1 Tax=Holothuria leucospilota TaxID=206669 RepID=A0A9Q1HA24_HOLLE|nr:Macrophage mannose receptor 1 [Holothuria leucospilota]